MNLNFENDMNLMWADYIKMNPEAQQIYKLFQHFGETILNDHIALRTFNHPQLGIQSLAASFIKYGYKSCGEYFFTEKKLYAQHFEHENKNYPKIFISELELEKMSSFVQETLNACAEQLSDATIQQPQFALSGKHWNAYHSTYLKLAAESEYAAWVYAYGFRPNHFTVSINALKNFNSIHKLNEFIKMNGVILNSAGGEIKGTPEELLEQSSTMASLLQLQFADGVYAVPGCYYEFAKRYKMPNGELYQGFIAKSADKIFESTNKI